MNDNMTYEEAVKRLDEIVSLLEQNEVSLDESLALFEEGTKLTAFCTKKLNEAKAKITEIEKD
ncbi:MAG: exodeoxyribonuclease VII small subunit [Ruminococcaceae bacterium]|jgi:exodeoxyribonuclease VII small subunit|nr:exodeoxyribonuclease VII small subunit [Oscillospiraceae bacterium]